MPGLRGRALGGRMKKAGETPALRKAVGDEMECEISRRYRNNTGTMPSWVRV